MTKFPQALRDFQQIVFVRLGHNEVKMGRVEAMRITLTPCAGAIHPEARIEYCVRWWEQGKREQKEEWFKPEYVCDDAKAAFDRSVGDDVKLPQVQWA